MIIKSIGERISGKTVKLVASNDVSLRAATNTSEKLENAKSKGWSVGANISVAGGGILGFDASANAAKQKGNTKVTTHTGTTVVGSDAVTITSGKDTHISGSKVIGKSVTADVGGNLSIESLQDTKTYVGESSNKGFSVSTNAGSLSNVSMSSNNGRMKSDYASVTDQAGMYAGDDGFVINTAKTTSLTGAVIDSTANSNKNKLSTKSLDVKDVENTAEYTSRNVGMSYNHVGNFKNLSKAGQDAVWNTLGKLPNLLPDSSKSASSTTTSAISNGTIEVRDANFNMQTLSRDTKDSLNKLDEIFDKKKIEERQELSKLFAKEAFGQLHNWNPTSKEGKTVKAIAHGVVAEVSARMAGNKPGSGFYAGATNEALIGEIQKIAKEKPDVAQTLSALLGAAVNGSLGHSPVTGAAEAQYGTKWNLELDYHAATVRQSAYEEMKRHYNSNYLRREILSYSPDEISEAKDNLERRLANAESSGAFAGSVELLGFFLDQSPSKHGIIDVDYTSNGYPIYIFGENSAFTQALKNDYELNRRLVRLAIKNRDNSGVDMPTDFDSTQFYTNSFDTAVGLGEATYIVTYKKDYINRRVEAKITITDDYDFSKEDARFDIYKSAYILQASRERRPYAYKATYDMEFPLSDVTEVHRWEG